MTPGFSARRNARSAYSTADHLLGLSRVRSIEKSDISRITSDKKVGMGLAPSAVRHPSSTEAATEAATGPSHQIPSRICDFPTKISPGLPDPADLLPKSCQILPGPAEILLNLSQNLSKSFHNPPEFSKKGSAVNRSAASIRPAQVVDIACEALGAIGAKCEGA